MTCFESIPEPPAILISDDDRAIRETLDDIFQVSGFRTRLAADGEEALVVLASEKIHLAVFDMHMPKLTGLEAIRLIKQSKSSIPCILISAALDGTLIKEAEQAEAYSVISKPIRMKQITHAVELAIWEEYRWRR